MTGHYIMLTSLILPPSPAQLAIVEFLRHSCKELNPLCLFVPVLFYLEFTLLILTEARMFT